MDRNIILAILASALVTALMRTAPILLLSRFRLPSAQQQWLSFIPSAIMAAIVTAELVGKPVLTSSGISISALAALGRDACWAGHAQSFRHRDRRYGSLFILQLFPALASGQWSSATAFHVIV